MGFRAARITFLVLIIAGLGACDLPFGQSGGGVNLGGYENKDAKDILSDAKSAVKGVKSWTIKFTGTDSTGQPIQFNASGDGNGGVKGSITTNGATLEYIEVGGKSYIKGKDFWAKAFGSAASSTVLDKIDDNYVVTPTNTSGSTSSFKNLGDPSTFADCLDVLTSPSRSGTDTVNGQKVVVIQSSATSAKLSVSTDSPHYPLKLTADKADTAFAPTATSGKCAGSSPSPGRASSSPSTGLKGSATFEFSDFGKAQKVEAPTNTVELSTLLTGG